MCLSPLPAAILTKANQSNLNRDCSSAGVFGLKEGVLGLGDCVIFWCKGGNDCEVMGALGGWSLRVGERGFGACLVIYLSKHAFLMALALYNHDLSLAAC